MLLTWDFNRTKKERVASKPSRAATDGVMSHNLAEGMKTTRSRTRVQTSSVDTGSVLCAIGAHKTFRSTRRWCTNAILLTSAHRVAANHSAIAVWTARISSARILRDGFSLRKC